MATMLKEKGSKLEFLTIPPTITERIVSDPRFLETIQATGNPAFQNEAGYLGQIAIGGSNSRVDLWEYDPALVGTKQSSDSTPVTWLPVWGGRYGMSWNNGTWLPIYFRVDDGFEVKVDHGIDSTQEVLRPNETRVITAGSAGTSFPGDFNHLVMGLCVTSHAHG
jgi:hypothetical protein